MRAVAAGLLLLLAAADVGPYGPAFGAKADVVRSFTLTTTGAIAREITGKKGDGKTGLRGQCNPTMFANFGIERGDFDQRADIYLITKGKIATGATGEFKLDTIWVSFYDDANGERKFGGPGTLTLTIHEASPGARRMKGTITGPKLEGLDTQKGKFIAVTASFDMDFSCGVK